MFMEIVTSKNVRVNKTRVQRRLGGRPDCSQQGFPTTDGFEEAAKLETQKNRNWFLTTGLVFLRDDIIFGVGVQCLRKMRK
jgi:hypothetical protein